MKSRTCARLIQFTLLCLFGNSGVTAYSLTGGVIASVGGRELVRTWQEEVYPVRRIREAKSVELYGSISFRSIILIRLPKKS